MPLLNWQAGMGQEVNDYVILPRFWIYWAITLPLTIVVLVLWGIWAYLTADRTAENDGVKYA